MKTLIRGGKVCLEDQICLADILIIQEKIVAVGNFATEVSANADQVIDARGLLVLPGAIDLHVHVDDQIGDYYLADTYLSASEVAIKNGITSFISFITQSKNSTLAAAIQVAETKAKNNCYCDYLWHLTPTTWDDESWQDISAAFARGYKSIKLYTTYKPAGIYSSYEEIAAILAKVKPFNVTTLIHCEDDNYLANIANTNNFNLNDAYSLALLRPQNAEILAVEKVIELAKTEAGKIHVVHVSTPESAEKIFYSKKDLDITCETGPQYLFFNDEALQQVDGYRYTCTPPLRNRKSQEYLRNLAQQGYLDAYATDHCPFAKRAKDGFKMGGNILSVPKGLSGLGALVPMVYKLYEGQGESALIAMMQKLATNPAKIAGIYPQKGTIKVGADADLIILNLAGPVRKIYSTCSDSYDPFAGFTTTLDYKYVLLRGKTVIKSNELVCKNQPFGECLC